MSQTWSERVLEGLLDLQEGEGNAQELLTVVETTQAGVQQQLQQLQQSWSQDPEMTEASAQRFQAAVESLFQALTLLRQGLAQGQELVWGDHHQRVLQALQTIQNLRQQQLQWSQRGPTSQPTVNRLLRHLDAWLRGVRSPATRTLLTVLPELDEHWGRIIEHIADPALQEQLEASLGSTMDLLETWSQCFDAPTPPEAHQWKASIVEALQVFDQVVSRKVESDFTAGPTPFPIVNLLAESLRKGSPNEWRSLAKHTEDLLRLQLSPETNTQIAAQQLYELLGEIRQTSQPEIWVDPLIDAADQLGVVAAIYSAPEEVLDYVNREGLSPSQQPRESLDLPPLLASLHQLAAGVIDGPVEPAQLESGLRHVEMIVERISSKVGRHPESPEMMEATDLALSDLRAAAQAGWELLDQPDEDALQALEEALLQCKESVELLK